MHEQSSTDFLPVLTNTIFHTRIALNSTKFLRDILSITYT